MSEHDEKCLDRIASSLDDLRSQNVEILDRVTRTEMIYKSHREDINRHQEQIQDVSHRVSGIEIRLAVNEYTTGSTAAQLFRRWAAVGAIILLVLNVAGAALSRYVMQRIDSPQTEEVSYDRFQGPRPSPSTDSGSERLRKPVD